MERVETIIIGAGVVGLAIARALALRGREVLILEAEGAVASVTSARNSGVIHAGFYYRPDSLKTRGCIQGARMLYAYAAERGIPHRRCGKLVVAQNEAQMATLRQLHQAAAQVGLTNVRLIGADEAKAMEPEVGCIGALHSPDSGIVDVHNYVMALLGDAEAAGAMLALQAPVTGGRVRDDGFEIDVGGASPMTLSCATLINAAGLGAQAVARQLAGLDAATIPGQALAKGNYFSIGGKQPFTMLVYPVPVMGSVGLHACCDMAGRVHFGPDIEWVDHIDYRVDPARAALFEEAVRRYWPGLPAGALTPDFSGIRPKLAKAGHKDTDFVIQTVAEHKIRGLINLYGIESPGLTSSLALGEWVAEMASAT